MLKGTVKWFNETKGYGFIKPDDGGADVFIHISALQRSGLKSLPDNQRVSYQIAVDPKRGKSSAVDIKLEG
jgi:cold shock protein